MVSFAALRQLFELLQCSQLRVDLFEREKRTKLDCQEPSPVCLQGKKRSVDTRGHVSSQCALTCSLLQIC